MRRISFQEFCEELKSGGEMTIAQEKRGHKSSICSKNKKPESSITSTCKGVHVDDTVVESKVYYS